MSQTLCRDSFLHDGLIAVLAVGGFLIILGLFFTFTPGIADTTTVFFNDLTTVTRSLSSSSTINLPAPVHPAEHLDFYTAVMNFMLRVGVSLVARFSVHLAGRQRRNHVPS